MHVRHNLFFRLLAGLLLTACAFVSRAEIVIGQSVPLSKTNASLGTDIRDGALAYFNHVNTGGGVNGQKIRLVTLDDQNSALLSGQNTERLISDYNALLLFGYASATLSVPALPLVEKHGIPLFAPFTGADTIHDRRNLVYTVRASYRDEMRAILTMWGGVGMGRYAIVHYDDPVGRQNFEAVQAILATEMQGAKATGVPIKRNAAVPAGTLDLIKKSDAQVIIFTTLAEPIADIARQLKKAQAFYNMVALSFAGTTQLREALGPLAHGMAMATVVPRYNNAALPVAREFRDAMNVAGFKNLSYASFESYVAAKILVEALKKAGPNPSRATFVKAMANLKRVDVGGYALYFDREALHGSKFVELALVDRGTRN